MENLGKSWATHGDISGKRTPNMGTIMKKMTIHGGVTRKNAGKQWEHI